jgi:hypothetical protein
MCLCVYVCIIHTYVCVCGNAEGIGVNKLLFIGVNKRFFEWLSAQSQMLKSAPYSGVMCVCLVSLVH